MTRLPTTRLGDAAVVTRVALRKSANSTMPMTARMTDSR